MMQSFKRQNNISAIKFDFLLAQALWILKKIEHVTLRTVFEANSSVVLISEVEELLDDKIIS
jgi:hypothetical protein